ncbi:LacI family DNA-binding transcriptional regulator [Thomasclavelia cocleata]|uniref:LacI family DNA-binding transcriptional regulator n=1 Tax=Thomasclavelia cocleata TaxID=69824 RepID=UPI002011D9DB|nr:LacI family DNA-binding transcriptional regulator [Thomasclavelia cocleata]
MKNKKLTMNDIAKMAGVGKSTVSRYFNGGYVKESTRLKLKKIIEEYNYEPSALANH